MLIQVDGCFMVEFFKLSPLALSIKELLENPNIKWYMDDYCIWPERQEFHLWKANGWEYFSIWRIGTSRIDDSYRPKLKWYEKYILYKLAKKMARRQDEGQEVKNTNKVIEICSRLSKTNTGV